MKSSRTFMVQGTTSDAGKSTLVTGLCRILYRQGQHVAPFKPQNMALNSAVTAEGGEIGRAQAVQAQACGLAPHTDMNPVLLKPSSDSNAQVILNGKALTHMEACEYHEYKTIAMETVLAAHQRLQQRYNTIIVEGAGSPAEINLRQGDIANMGFAEAVDCPVILIADIDRGGVFAHLMGTLALLSESERSRIQGFVINRFRGERSLLDSGLDWLEHESGKPVLGVLPYLHGLHLEAEDGLSREACPAQHPHALHVVVPALPHISNHTDFDPLRLHPQVNFFYVGPDQNMPQADLIIIPGSKNVSHDLQWLLKQGWGTAILRHLRYGGKLMGICGGFQMLGNHIHDPLGIESPDVSTPGLALLKMETTIGEEKILRQCHGHLSLDNAEVTGYEIHMGISTGPALSRPAAFVNNHHDGAISDDNQILGTYLHGLFENTAACNTLLHWAGLQAPENSDLKSSGLKTIDYIAHRESEINRLADCIEEHLDLSFLEPSTTRQTL